MYMSTNTAFEMQTKLYDLLHDAPCVPTVFPMNVGKLCDFARALHDEGYPVIEVLARPHDDMLQVFQEISRRPERGSAAC